MCKLCLSDIRPIRASHIIPAWAYRRATINQGLGNRHPVWSGDRRYFQTALQLKDYLLCDECEQKIGRYENAVSKFAGNHNRRSTLLELPRRFPSLGWMEPEEGQVTLRFAIAVFLRAHFSSKGPCRRFRLPDGLVEPLRLFLLDVGQPLSCPILLTAIEEPDDLPLMRTRVSFPVAFESPGQYSAMFVICGLAFDLFHGDEVDPALFRISISHGSRRWVRMEPWTKRPEFVKWVQDGHRAARRGDLE